MEKYYALYNSWLTLLDHNTDNGQISFRVHKVHAKIKEARLEEFPKIYAKLLMAYELYNHQEFQECYNTLGLLYGEVMADITDRTSPTLDTNIIAGNNIVIITQDLHDGKIINMQLRR